MELFKQNSKFYKRNVLSKMVDKLFFFFIFISITIFVFFSETDEGVKVIMMLTILCWCVFLLIKSDSLLQELKKKYYPNGQLKKEISNIRFNPGLNSNGPFSITLKTSWYENGQKKSYVKIEDTKIVLEEYWEESGKKIIPKSKEQDNFYEYLINKEKTSSEPKDTELELLVKGLKEEEEGFDEDDWLSMKPIISRKNDLITVEYDNLCGTDYIKVENDRYYFDTDYPDDDIPKGDEYPPFRLTQEMEKSIKEEVIPFLKRRYKNLNSKKDYIKMDNEYIIDNVELFERRLDDLLFDEFQNGEKRGRNKKWNLKFSIDEDQLKMELGIEFLYDYDW